MKKLKFILIFVAVLIVLYVGAVLLGVNLPKPAFLDSGIEGNAELKVTLLMNNKLKNPVNKVEVDVAKKPGQPPKGGIATTDESGVAVFKIKPGIYYIYFNDVTFPKNIAVPEARQVTVDEKSVKEETFLIDTRR